MCVYILWIEHIRKETWKTIYAYGLKLVPWIGKSLNHQSIIKFDVGSKNLSTKVVENRHDLSLYMGFCAQYGLQGFIFLFICQSTEFFFAPPQAGSNFY